jgi:hypothetical protein
MLFVTIIEERDGMTVLDALKDVLESIEEQENIWWVHRAKVQNHAPYCVRDNGDLSK